MIAQDRQSEEANYEEQNRPGSTIFGYQSFFGGTLIFSLPPREMIHSSLKPWWDAEWKQMRACQRWQEKLISSQCPCGFWWERGPEAGPKGGPGAAQAPPPGIWYYQSKKVIGSWLVSIKTSLWSDVKKTLKQPLRKGKGKQRDTRQKQSNSKLL